MPNPDRFLQAKAYVNGLLVTFEVDPADSDYQEGFKACAQYIRDVLYFIEISNELE
jgi:hypothetical protein